MASVASPTTAASMASARVESATPRASSATTRSDEHAADVQVAARVRAAWSARWIAVSSQNAPAIARSVIARAGTRSIVQNRQTSSATAATARGRPQANDAPVSLVVTPDSPVSAAQAPAAASAAKPGASTRLCRTKSVSW